MDASKRQQLEELSRVGDIEAQQELLRERQRQNEVIERCAIYWHGFAVVPSEREIMAMAPGAYQRRLLEGSAAWSAADLRGKARDYAAGYKRSRNALLHALAERFGAIAYYGIARGERSCHVELVARSLAYVPQLRGCVCFDGTGEHKREELRV